jgi:hypothetical protein
MEIGSVPVAPPAPGAQPIISKSIVGNVHQQMETEHSKMKALQQKFEDNVVEAMPVPSDLIIPHIDTATAFTIPRDLIRLIAEYGCNLPDLEVMLRAALPAGLQAEMSGQLKAVQALVADMLNKNQQRFEQYRQLGRRGVQWPYSSEERNKWESAGFVFRPMMIKRDRMVCEGCGVEVSGLAPWAQLQYYHNYEKHGDGFKEKLAKQGMTVVPYGQNVPSRNPELLYHVLQHLDLYVQQKPKVSADLAKCYEAWRGSMRLMHGWILVAQYICNQK